MSDIKITSVKLIKQGEKLEVSYRKSGDLQESIDMTIDNVVHPDLVKAMEALVPHLAILTSQILPKDYKKNEILKEIQVNGYHIGGKEGQEGISIVGGRTGTYGYFGLNAPFLRIEGSSEENQYILLKELESKIEKIEAETLLFMNGEKMAQPSMFPEKKETAEKLQIAKPVAGFPKDQSIANPEAMERIKKDDLESKSAKKKGGKRVAQSPENKSGIVSE